MPVSPIGEPPRLPAVVSAHFRHWGLPCDPHIIVRRNCSTGFAQLAIASRHCPRRHRAQASTSYERAQIMPPIDPPWQVACRDHQFTDSHVLQHTHFLRDLHDVSTHSELVDVRFWKCRTRHIESGRAPDSRKPLIRSAFAGIAERRPRCRDHRRHIPARQCIRGAHSRKCRDHRQRSLIHTQDRSTIVRNTQPGSRHKLQGRWVPSGCRSRLPNTPDRPLDIRQ